MGAAAQLADLPVVLGPGARHRRLPDPGVADLREMCVADPEMGAVTNTAKAKGDRAELEVQALLRDLLGVPARRKLGAGRLDDMGDLDGVPDTCIAVANYKDIARALREKVDPCVTQQERAGATFGATFIRRPGGRYLVVQTPTQWAALWREATSS